MIIINLIAFSRIKNVANLTAKTSLPTSLNCDDFPLTEALHYKMDPANKFQRIEIAISTIILPILNCEFLTSHCTNRKPSS